MINITRISFGKMQDVPPRNHVTRKHELRRGLVVLLVLTSGRAVVCLSERPWSFGPAGKPQGDEPHHTIIPREGAPTCP